MRHFDRSRVLVIATQIVVTAFIVLMLLVNLSSRSGGPQQENQGEPYVSLGDSSSSIAPDPASASATATIVTPSPTRTPEPATNTPTAGTSVIPSSSPSTASMTPTLFPPSMTPVPIVLTPTPSPPPTSAPLPSMTPVPTVPTPLPPPPTSGDRTRLAVFIGSGDAGTVNLLKGTGAKATRVTLEWSRVEANFTNPPTYDFYLDSLLAALGAAGISPLVEIRNNPSWASSTNCGPIDKPGGQAAFSRFVQAIVSRYSRAPYNVKQWEFYNEADNRDMVTLGLWLGGCWGDYPAQYASMLQAAYSAVKAADPAAQVLTGGLAHENTASFNMSFIDQILAAGAGNYFDVLNIHYFSSFEFAWSASGVDIIGKVQAVRQKMANYGVSKPVAVTEASWTSTPSNSPNFAAANGEAQSRYVAKLLSRSLSLNLHMVVWFSLADWAGAGYPYGLLNVNNQQRPSYSAFQEASRQFDGAEFVRAVSPGDVGVTGGIEGYAFNAGGRWLWALWATGEPLAVTVPGAASSARNKMGQTIPLAGGGNPTSLQLDDSPIFVRF